MPGKRTTWRGTYAEETAFALCPRWRLPQWLHLIPDLGYVSDFGLSPQALCCRRQVASAPHQSNPTALSNPYKGEKRQSGVVTAQRPTRPHLRHPSELTQARTLVLDLCLQATVGTTGGWNPGENLSSWPVPCQPCTKWANGTTLAF